MARTGIRTLEVRDLADLLRLVTPDKPDPQSGRLRDTSVYRGTHHADWPLLTSLDRLGCEGPDDEPHQKVHLEWDLFRHFHRRARTLLDKPIELEWEMRILAQHHGLPTRLLDWSYSPLVAAHFATLGGEPGRDRVVWRLDWKGMHRRFNLPERAYTVANLHGLRDGTTERAGIPVDQLFEEAERGERDHLALLLEPPTLDARVLSQGAAFTVSSDTTRSLDRLLEDSGAQGLLTRFIFPASSVDRLRDQLDLCSITEGRLFPDLDGAAREITRWYAASPRHGRT